MTDVYQEIEPPIELGPNLDDLSQLLKDFSSNLREDRFKELFESSEGILEDTWYEGNGHDVLRHWPGGSFENGFSKLFKGERQVLEEFCEKEDFEALGVGSGRVVVKPEDHETAFKVARAGISGRFGSGRESNHVEAERWKDIEEAPLMPVYAVSSDYSWLACPVMTSYEAYRGDADLEEIISGIESALKPYSEKLCLRDLGEDNIGYRNEDWYWIDYGQPRLEDSRLYGPITGFSRQDIISEE